MLWYVLLLVLGDNASIHGQIMLQPFPSRLECERSADYLIKQNEMGTIQSAYCIERPAK